MVRSVKMIQMQKQALTKSDGQSAPQGRADGCIVSLLPCAALAGVVLLLQQCICSNQSFAGQYNTVLLYTLHSPVDV